MNMGERWQFYIKAILSSCHLSVQAYYVVHFHAYLRFLGLISIGTWQGFGPLLCDCTIRFFIAIELNCCLYDTCVNQFRSLTQQENNSNFSLRYSKYILNNELPIICIQER